MTKQEMTESCTQCHRPYLPRPHNPDDLCRLCAARKATADTRKRARRFGLDVQEMTPA